MIGHEAIAEEAKRIAFLGLGQAWRKAIRSFGSRKMDAVFECMDESPGQTDLACIKCNDRCGRGQG